MECLAIVWAVQKCRFYLHGIQSFGIITDHRPLVGIFTKALHDLPNQRLMKFRESLTDYSFHVTWQAGKVHLIADALSRAPVFPPECDGTERVFSNLCLKVAKDPGLQCLFDAIDDDYLLQVKAVCKNDPKSVYAKDLMSIWDTVSLLDDEELTLILIDGQNIFVPQKARPQILSRLHVSHQGIVKTRLLAQQNYFWPGMLNDVKIMIETCEQCQVLRPSLPKEPLAPRDPALFPTQDVRICFRMEGKLISRW